MSKTVDDLVKVFDEAHWSAHSRRAGIAAVIMAVRDHLKAETPHWSDGWGIIEVENELNEILGDAGNEKVAGGSGQDAAPGSIMDAAPATDPAPAVCEYRNAFVAYENRNWQRRGCNGEVVYREAPGHCLYCGKPIKFTEAK